MDRSTDQYESANRKDIVSICKEMEHRRHFFICPDFQTAKRTGGDLICITRSCAEKNSLKIEVGREIQTMIAGKKMESRIMNAIPLGMIVYFRLCSPGFLDCMYRAGGRIVMTILMSIYLIAYYWSDRICDIRV